MKQIEKILDIEPKKTNDRIYMETCEIISKTNPLKDEDGLEYTEDFDGKIEKEDCIYYFNLKFCCDSGGAQNRTMREVYHFIKYQLKVLEKISNISGNTKDKKLYFINILDGDTSYEFQDKFNYLLKKKSDINKYMFIGDMKTFSENKELIKLIKTNNT